MVAMKEPFGAAYAVGRLTGWEPLGFEAGDNNWYRFVANGPAGKTDPTGLTAMSGVLVAGGGCALADGPLPFGDVVGLGVIVVGAIVVTVYASPDCEPKRCLPCDPPVGTIAFEIHVVPPSRPHWPHPGTHTHLWVMHQSPPHAGCGCFWQNFDVIAGGTPPAGAVPVRPALGGGVQ
jgi:hypothetical protein